MEDEGLSEHTYLTQSEAALYARCSLDTINRMVRNGRLVKHKLGSKALFARADLDALITGRGAAA